MQLWKKILLGAAGFGGGFAVVSAIIFGAILWWSYRPVKPKPMNPNAITAKFSGMAMGIREETLHLTVTYSLHNTTDRDYTLPSLGEMMVVNPENKGLDTFEGITWDTTSRIPLGQTVNLKFDVPYALSSYNKTAADLTDLKAEVEFIKNRLKEIDGFRFFDYSERYEIDLPKWPVTQDTP